MTTTTSPSIELLLAQRIRQGEEYGIRVRTTKGGTERFQVRFRENGGEVGGTRNTATEAVALRDELLAVKQ